MKRILLIAFVGVLTTLTLDAQTVVKGSVDIQDTPGSKLQLTDTVANKTWELVSGLYSGFQIGYLTGNLTGTNSPFYIGEDGKVGIGTTTTSTYSGLTVAGGITSEGDIRLETGFGLISSGQPFISESNQNIFMGSNAGNSSMTGSKNMFFGSNSGILNTTGQNNVAFGLDAGSANTTGSSNAFFGYEAGKSNTIGNYNSFFGMTAGATNSTGTKNSFFGFGAGRLNTTGGSNAFFGSETGRSNTTGNSNTFVGNEAGRANSTGTSNVFVGNSSGRSNVSGVNNTFIGARSGNSNTTASSNSFFGYEAGRNNTTGDGNIFVGLQSGVLNTTGSQNVFMGNEAGKSNLIGIRNTFIGTWAGNKNTASHNSFFGYNSGGQNTSGDKNAFFGNVAGYANETGVNNTYLGYAAGSANNGTKNVYLGSNAGSSGALANENVAIGYLAGQKNSSATGRNTLIGTEAGNNSINGSSNIAIGYRAGRALEGEGNVAIGINAGADNTAAGNYNVFLGYEAGLEGANESERLYIANKRVSQRTALIYGQFDNGKVGINTTTLEANSALTVGGKIAATEYLLADGSPLLGSIASSPWTATASDITFGTGKVGIGTTTLDATSALTVGGDLKAEGDISLASGFDIKIDSVTFISGASNNTFLGMNTGADNSTGDQNTFGGYHTGEKNTTGSANTFFGNQAGAKNTTASYNSYIGNGAGENNNGLFNTFVGSYAGRSGVLTKESTFLGVGAGMQNNDADGKNVFVGNEAGKWGVNGSGNVAVGFRSGFDSEGENNLFLGAHAGHELGATGSNNVFLGYMAGVGDGNSSDRLYIANQSIANRTALIYGQFDNGKIGINTTTLEDSSALTVGGKIAATEYLLADGSPLLGSIASSPWTATSDDITFDTGKVGIGTTSPESMLHIKDGVSGGVAHSLSRLTVEGSDKSMVTILTPNDKVGFYGFGDADDSFVGGLSYNHLKNLMLFRVNDLLVAPMAIDSLGFVGLGTNTPQEKLEVVGNTLIQGNLEVMKVVVTATPGQGWPDYVFEPEFKLRPLSEVEAFVKQNKHLPEVPSAKEVEANGIDLGNMDATLLKKVEEFTLYMIEMNKKIEKLEEENKQLKELIKKNK